MQGRQAALEDRSRWHRAAPDAAPIRVGAKSELDPDRIYTIETQGGRYCVRHWQGGWHAHSAVCPHQLGPLQDSEIDAAGHLSCPWHGYRFDLSTGHSLQKECSGLAQDIALIEREGVLFLEPQHGPGSA